MNKDKPIKHGCMFFLTSVVVFLFGCSQEQKASTETKQQPTSQEVAVEPAEVIKQTEVQTEVNEVTEKAATSQEDSTAKQKLEFASQYLKIAQKGMSGYSQIVAICRGVIKDYPGTDYERQAKELLRQVPEDQRSQFHLTDEELGY